MEFGHLKKGSHNPILRGTDDHHAYQPLAKWDDPPSTGLFFQNPPVIQSCWRCVRIILAILCQEMLKGPYNKMRIGPTNQQVPKNYDKQENI